MQIAREADATQNVAKPGFLHRTGPLPAAAEPALGTTRSFGKDDGIFAEGDPATCFYRVVSGAVRTSQLLSDGRRQIDAFHLPGDVFGIEADSRHHFGAEAIEPTMLIAYRRRNLETLASDDSAFAQQTIAAIIHALERARAHMLLLGRKTALERIATFLLDLSARLPCTDHIELPMSRIDIADHLGLTIETVSRSLTQLERERIIEVPAQRRSIILRDRAALRRLGA